MSSRMGVNGKIVAAILVVAGTVGCSGSASEPVEAETSSSVSGDLIGDNFIPATDSTADSLTEPGVDGEDGFLASCDEASVPVADDWPFGVADDIIVAETVGSDEEFLLIGATRDAEQVLIDSMDTAFPGFDVGTPAGGVNDMIVDFTSESGEGRLVLEDPDQDGCWSVAIRAVIGSGAELEGEDPAVIVPSGGTEVDDSTGSPDLGDGAGDPFVDDDPVSGSDDEPDVDDTIDDVPVETVDPFDVVVAVGSGEVLSARGSFRVAISLCSVSPLQIDGIAAGATLTVASGAVNAVEVTWAYDDGVVIEDLDAQVLRLDESGGTVIANGVNDDGPETLFIEFLCD